MSKVWSQSHARRLLLGSDSMNPSIAAKSLLDQAFGRGRVGSAIRKYNTRRRPSRPGNPDLGAVASLIPGGGVVASIAKLLGGRFKKPSEVRAAALAPAIVQAANAGNLTAARGLIERAARPMKVAEGAVWKAAAAQLSGIIVAAVQKHLASIPQPDQAGPEQFAQSVLANPVQLPGTTGAAPGLTANLLSAPGNLAAAAGIIRTLAPKQRRAPRGRYPSYVDRNGQQRYSTKPPGSELRIPAGATPSAGTPYSFFRGAVGGGGAAATAGQVALAAGAGLAAYLVTRRLLQLVGGRAQAKEEAGVNAARALHQALEDYKQQKGAYPPPAERAEMKQVYRDKLVELGYDPDTFQRTRSGFENFVEDYNPFN